MAPVAPEVQAELARRVQANIRKAFPQAAIRETKVRPAAVLVAQIQVPHRAQARGELAAMLVHRTMLRVEEAASGANCVCRIIFH